MPLMKGSKTYDPLDDFDTDLGGYDLHPAIGLYFAAPGGHRLVSLADPLPVTGGGGGGVGILDTDDNLLVAGQTTLLAIDENYVFNAVAGNWIRWQGGIDNSPAAAFPQVGLVGGKVTDPLDVYADGDVCAFNFSTAGRLLCDAAITTPLALPASFEVALSQAVIAAGGTFTSATVQLNSTVLGSLGREVLHGSVNYAGTSARVQVVIDGSIDAGATFYTLTTFDVFSGTTFVLQDYPVPATHLRVRVINTDGVNTTGAINLYFKLTFWQ